jgi:hypothetical protein
VRCGARASGAPSTHVPSSVTNPDQRSDDEKGTSSRTVHRTPGNAPASATVVRFGVVTLRAKAPSGVGSRPATGSTSERVSRPVVSVPVLSVQTTSTSATDSTALTC